MNRVVEALGRIAADLDHLDARWALIGGFAVSARAEPRFTRDVDLAVVVRDDVEAEQLVYALQSDGYRVVAAVEQDAAGRLATARLVPPPDTGGDVVVDLLFASAGVEPEIVAAAERLAILPNVVVPVATTGHLIALKLLARDDQTRPQDVADLRALLQVADETDLALARTAIAQITARGFSRDRDLEAALTALLAT